VAIPFLVDAENCLFELDGGPHKIGGTSKVNSVAVASGAAVMGVYDYWRQGTAGSPSRKRILHAGTVCMNDNDDGTFVNLFTGLESGRIPSYSTFDDLLIIASDSATDVPKSWDQTTAQNLAGTPPRFSFRCAHKNRQWAAGVQANPSRLYYSANVDPEDWVGAGVRVDRHRHQRWRHDHRHREPQGRPVRVQGAEQGLDSPDHRKLADGSDAFARTTSSAALGRAGTTHLPVRDDLGFVSQYGSVHSLSATQAFGDFEERLSRPINIGWIRSHLNYNRLRNIWAVTDPLNGRLLHRRRGMRARRTTRCS
jgi:hypothetical protein